VDKKRVYVPLSPQPAEDDVVTLTRYYGTCKASDAFRKRVTWFGGNVSSSSSAPVAVVEYRGVQPAPQPHGNATHNTVAYVRVPATTMEAVGEEVLHANPKTVYNSQLLKEDVCDAPRNAQAVRDKKKYN